MDKESRTTAATPSRQARRHLARFPNFHHDWQSQTRCCSSPPVIMHCDTHTEMLQVSQILMFFVCYVPDFPYYIPVSSRTQDNLFDPSAHIIMNSGDTVTNYAVILRRLSLTKVRTTTSASPQQRRICAFSAMHSAMPIVFIWLCKL